MIKNYKVKHALGALVFLAFFAAAAAIIMLLWNALIPSIIGWTAIGYWQACGLILLCRLLFTGFGKMGFGHSMMAHGMGHKHMGHLSEVRERMNGMSRKEKHEYIRRRMEEFHGQHCEAEVKKESAE